MAFLRRNAVAVFILLNLFVGGVAFVANLHPDDPIGPAVWYVMGFSPCLTALLLTWVLGGWRDVGKLLSGLFAWRVHCGWYLTALLAFLALHLLPYLVWWGLLGEGPSLRPDPLYEMGLGRLVWMILVVMIGEEVGWRGFLQPRLQERWNALGAALVVGVVWALWHGDKFALLFALDIDFEGMRFLLLFSRVAFALTTVGLAVIFAWIYNSTRGSLLLVGLAHHGANLWFHSKVYVEYTAGEDWPFTVVFILLLGAFCALVIGRCGRGLRCGERARSKTESPRGRRSESSARRECL